MTNLIISSTKNIFRENFHSLSTILSNGANVFGSISVNDGCDLSGGGYLLYLLNYLPSLPHWSIYIKCNVGAAGSDRTLLAVGKSGTGDRFELGVDASGDMYMTGASGTVTSTDSVSTGDRKLLFTYDGSNIIFYVDGVRIGIEAVSLGNYLLPFIFIGAATDGSSRKWGSSISEIRIFNYPFNETESFGISDVNGWTPKNLLSAYGGNYDDGLYWDGDDDGAYGLNTQPVLVNNKFNNQSGWTLGANWSIANGLLTHAPGNTAGASQDILITGNRYSLDWNITEISGDSVSITPPGTARSTVDIYSEEGTAANTVLSITPNSAFDGSVDWVRNLRNISCNNLYPYTSGTFKGSTFTQSLATDMCWKDSDMIGAKFDGANDRADSSTVADVWKIFNDGTGATLFVNWYQHAWNSSVNGIFDTLDGTQYTDVGINIYGRPTGALGDMRMVVSDGSGVAAVDSGFNFNALTLGWNILTFRISTTSFDLRVGGVSIFSGVPNGTTASAPKTTAKIGSYASDVNRKLNGTISKLGVFGAYLTDSEVTMVEDYLTKPNL